MSKMKKYNPDNWARGDEYKDLRRRRNSEIKSADGLGEEMKAEWRFIRDTRHVCELCGEVALMQMWNWLDRVNGQTWELRRKNETKDRYIMSHKAYKMGRDDGEYDGYVRAKREFDKRLADNDNS